MNAHSTSLQLAAEPGLKRVSNRKFDTNLAHDVHRHCAGLSLIELMVTIVIALFMSLAIFSTLATSEANKRRLTSSNDTNQVGDYAAYQIDKLIRSAGSGFSQSAASTFGCSLRAALAGKGTILPFSGAMAAPFTTLNSTLGGSYVLAPVIIAKNATIPGVSASTTSTARSDALIIMAGAGGSGEVPTLLNTGNTGSQINPENTVSFKADDLIMVGDAIAQSPPRPCVVQQVGSPISPTSMPLSGSYATNPINGTDLATFSPTTQSAQVFNLGTSSQVNPPSFSIIGVGDNNNLLQYDLLQMGTYNTPQSLADGVFEMHALYGVSTATPPNGKVDSWVDPGAAGYDFATLSTGTTGLATLTGRILAIRVGLIMRTNLAETTSVGATEIKLFSDLGNALTFKRTLNPAEQNYRYRTVEMTIPLRNVLLQN